ncbi:MAG: alpha-amylase [Muribaculaceae bacterium]|nr:alpha-amylase [Muribaculaceae bacterium]
MNRFFTRALALGLLGTAMAANSADCHALGWPSHYEGVMLQGFYWDSYDDTKWTNLESQADELSKYFKLIWVPNSGKCDWMGYMPQYWFTNHNSAFGTEEELLSMISTFKEKGTGFIADVVINHRNGVTNWYDFPEEEWNGQTWKIGLEGICSNDEMAYAAGQPKPTGNPDTGDNFDGCRDLDHTNANVQNNCKNYVKCLKEKYGYAGMRYDMVKGYGGQYNKIYNTYADVEYSVGEYWDSNYDAVAAWIEATGKTSAAFDFPCKYAINEAFASGDLRKLVWKANGTTDQPAGMIHWWYPRYSVTFVDNHDTYRDGSAFKGNVAAANAFILMSPGTPCVFLPHYQEYKADIQNLINIRNAVGINNESEVRVIQSTADCYMAEVTGTKGKAVVKIGSAWVSPEGYSDPDIKGAGNDYCVWVKSDINIGGGDDDSDTMPDHFYILGHANGNDWASDTGVEMEISGDSFVATVDFAPIAAAQTVSATRAAVDPYAYFSFAKSLGTTWDELNVAGNRFAPAADMELIPDGASAKLEATATPASAKAYKVMPGKYDVEVNWKNKSIALRTTVGSGVENIEADSETADYYTLQGVRISEPKKGEIYIRVAAGKAAKIIF